MLRRLEAHDFRNLAPLAWEPGPGRHLLLGGNGAGKTSLLEAVYAVATTRSFRTPRLAECVRHGAGGFRLVAEVEAAARATLAVGYEVDGSGGLDRSVNGERGPLSEHLEVLPVVAWSTADLEVVSGPPSERRRFLDRGVVSLRPGALAALRRYREALREKRELLARAGRPGAGGAPGTLQAWNRVLAEAAVEVARLRAVYAEELSRRVSEVLGEVRDAGISFPEITLRYRPSPAEAREGADALAVRLDRAADSERRRGMPLLGPHRDELEIAWGGHPADRVASAGERKSLSLSLAAAHGRVLAAAGREPAHLLDDLDAELAPDTLAALWKIFAGATQLIATSNRPAVWEGLAVNVTTRLRSGRMEE
jgi:DNA replication and repair protein RecF